MNKEYTLSYLPIFEEDIAKVRDYIFFDLAWINNPELIDICDIILVTIHPFFSEIPIENADFEDITQDIENVIG
jgi:exo-beta-1,3-glucanase (GH17 family)